MYNGGNGAVWQSKSGKLLSETNCQLRGFVAICGSLLCKIWGCGIFLAGTSKQSAKVSHYTVCNMDLEVHVGGKHCTETFKHFLIQALIPPVLLEMQVHMGN